MSIVRIDNVLDTLNTFIELQRPLYDTVINQFYSGRRLNIFLGRRASIPASSLPSIEIVPSGASMKWFACRVQETDPVVEFDITTDNKSPEQAIRLESALVTITSRIFAAPPVLFASISGTYNHMIDSFPKQVTYGTAGNGAMRVATISWDGRILQYLTDEMFSDPYQVQMSW